MSGGPALVIAPHPDDEVLGPGGTIARMTAEGREVVSVVVTRADPSLFPGYSVEEGRAEAERADKRLGIGETIFLEGFPAAMLDTVPLAHLNAAIAEVVRTVEPETLLIPFPGDLHRDHRVVAEACLVAARPNGGPPIRRVLAYETVSETNWFAAPLTPAFHPNVYVDIDPYLETKLAAAAEFRTQLKDFPHERSLEALRALAATRGAASGSRSAEAFFLIREIAPIHG